MSSTILMVIVLVVMWLVVLVPMVVRRHEETTETRSTERFATAMRVLSRRTLPTSGATPARSWSDTRPSSSPPYRFGSAAGSHARAEARRRMIARRRRTLSLLGLLTLASSAGAATVGRLLWLATAAGAVLLLGYVVWLRQQVRRQQERNRRRAAVFARTGPNHQPHAVRPARPTRSGRRGAGADRDATPAARTTDRAAAQSEAGDSASSTAHQEADRTWRPTPVPTPTYVGKPAAHQRPHRPGDTASAVPLDDDDPTFADIDDVVPSVEHRRAVNS